MIFHFSGWALDIDVERTRAYYQSDILDGCDCLSCQNFCATANLRSDGVEQFFQQLGVDYLKVAELCIPCCETPDGPMLYDGWYHLCGTILERPENNAAHRLDETCSVWFTFDCELLDEEFPRPAIQMNLHATVPWVLDRKDKQEYLL